MKSVQSVSNYMQLGDTAKPNWLFRGLIIVSLLVHGVLFMHIAEIYPPRTLSYMELTMRSVAKPSVREIPRPRTRPVVKSRPVKVPTPVTEPLKIPVDPRPETTRLQPVPDMSQDSFTLPQSPVVKDLNVSAWTPATTAREPVALPSNVSHEITEEAYQDIVDRKIRGSVQYPARAKKRNLQGRVVITVTIDAEGGIAALAVTQSSGHKVLDRAVLKAVRESAPFSSPPDGTVTVIIPIQFRLI